MSADRSPEKLLDALCSSTPTSRLMLLEAWDGLSLESQMRVLSRVATRRNDVRDRELIDKALASPNAYVRYLAASGNWLYHYGGESLPWVSECIRRIEQDPSPLVRYAREHGGLMLSERDAEELFAEPREQRLARIKTIHLTSARWFADVLRAAVRTAIPPVELLEMIEEWSACEGTALYFDLGASVDPDVDELWHAAEALPRPYIDAKRFLTHTLRMTNEEFARRLKQKATAMEMRYFQGLSPVQKLCVTECCCWTFDSDANGLAYVYPECARKLELLPQVVRAKHIRELQAYELAKWLVPWTDQATRHETLPKELNNAHSMVEPDDTWGTFEQLNRSMRSGTIRSEVLNQYIGTHFGENGFETPPGNDEKRPRYLTALRYLWTTATGAITLLIVLAMFGYAKTAFQTLTVGALAIIYATVRNGGEAFALLARILDVQFSRLAKLLNDPKPFRPEESPEEVARKQRSGNIEFFINMGFNIAIWVVAAWNILGVVL